MLSEIRRKKDRRAQLDQARQQLSELRADIGEAYEVFNSTVDPQLLEATIFEISALQSRYSCLLRSLKSLQSQ